MQFARFSTLSIVALAAVTAALLGRVVADEVPAVKQVPSQPRIEHPYINALLGSWSTSSVGRGSSSGKTQFKMGVGDTTVMQEYVTDAKLPDGSGMKVFGHGMSKVSADGRAVTTWWIDNYLAEPIRLTGPITENGFDVSGTTPDGKLRITFERTSDGPRDEGLQGRFQDALRDRHVSPRGGLRRARGRPHLTPWQSPRTVRQPRAAATRRQGLRA